VYLESVQYGLDYVLGVCKCLQVSVCIVKKRVCNRQTDHVCSCYYIIAGGYAYAYVIASGYALLML